MLSRRAAWIVALIVALVAGVARFALVPSLRLSRLHARSLPGFSAALPGGRIERDDHDYARGTFLVHIDEPPLNAVVSVVWQPSDGKPLSPQELETIAQIFANGLGRMPKGKATPVSIAGADGKPLGGVHVGDDMWVTMSPCGARDIVVTTIASRGSERLHRRVVASIACTPDEAQEALVRGSGSALVLDLPGWRAVESTPILLQLTNDKAIVLLTKIPDNIDNSLLPPVLTPMAKAQGMVVTFDPPRDGRLGFSMKSGNDNISGWARVFHCAKSSEAMMAFAETRDAAEALWSHIGNARCLKPGEAAQTWPASAKQ